jgi:hypothetical protein
MQMDCIPDFPTEDLDWLSKQAERRGVEIYQFVNELIDAQLSEGFYLDRPMSEAEASQAFAEQLRKLVRKARLGVV